MSSDSSDDTARAEQADEPVLDDEAPPDIPDVFSDLEASSDILRAAAAKADSVPPPVSRRLAPPPKPKRDTPLSTPSPHDPAAPGESALGSIRAPKAPTIEYVAPHPSDAAYGIEDEVTVVRQSSRPPPPIDDAEATPPVIPSGTRIPVEAAAPPVSAHPPPAPSSRVQSQPTIQRPQSQPTIQLPESAPSVQKLESQPSIQLPESQPPVQRPPSPPSIRLQEPPPSVQRPQSVPSIQLPESAPSVQRPQSAPSISIPRPNSVPRPVSNPPLVPRPASRPPPAQRPPVSPISAKPPPSVVRERPSSPPADGERHAATSYPPPPPEENAAPLSAAPATQPSAEASPTPKSSLHPMRIIAIVQPTRGPAEAAPPAEAEAAPPAKAEAAPPAKAEAAPLAEIDASEFDRAAAAQTAEELSDDDVSPDSSEQTAAAAEELGRDDALSIPPEEIATEEVPPAREEVPSAKTEGAKPPPPPRRTPRPPPPVQTDAEQKKQAKQRKAWWEEMFGEDFVRASWKVSDEQIRREVTFIEESLGVAPGGVVLDLGCGAGHHAVEFASRGYGVVGYDLSLYQLALAAEVAQEKRQKINFLQGDMREMAFEEMFDGVFCWNTTFGYFEEEKNLAVAQRVFRALRPGGMFLIDVINRDFVATQAPNSVWFEGDSCVCMDDMSIDFIASRLRVKRSLILDDGRSKECTYSVRLYSFHELGKLLHEVGFRVTEASGHSSTPGVFFGQHSPRVIMLAQRP